MTRNIYAEYREAIVTTLRKRDGDWCQICADVIDFPSVEIDHRNPVASGGENSLDNYRLVHPLCNRPGRAPLDRVKPIKLAEIYLGSDVCVKCGKLLDTSKKQRYCSERCGNAWRVNAFRLRKQMEGKVIMLSG